jgi:hypothetical protein
MKATIKGAYNKSLDGQEYKAKTGTYFMKVLLVGDVDETKVYETFYLTQKAYWKVEAMYKSAGVDCPAFDDFVFSDTDALIGKEVNISVGQDENGYNSVLKWSPALGAEKVEAEKVEEVKEDPKVEGYDPDLDEDVPF